METRLADAINMARHQVATDKLVERETSFEVDPIAGAQFTKGCAAQGFGGDIHREGAAGLAGNGHAGAINGDRFAERHAAER